ncbi:Transcription initiation factor TFIID subunit 9 [Frankliniella fusca]|uniref:Transcription initiation factor TFIID subunit 9 n=1 Tax=Frankliniella fusca TaxID=407009 RepID=A0AAE1LD85_9NEOP|nr:Transcription initiation factor TFIID subunit 9 [Frankliniella fusca]
MGSQSRNPNFPKDAQVIMSMLKDMGVQDYEQRVLNQLLEFTYRYVTCILDDSRVYATHAKKKTIDLDDVKLAVNMQLDRSFTTPPPREILLEVARSKNSQPLPVVKPSCGIRLPPDRYCLSSVNYKLRNNKKAPASAPVGPLGRLGNPTSFIQSPLGVSNAIKLQTSKGQTASLAGAKRGSMLTTVARTQSVTIPKPVFKFTQGAITAKAKPKPQIPQTSGAIATLQTPKSEPSDTTVGSVTSIMSGVKRPREDDADDL